MKIDAQSTADSLIAFETALHPLYRAKHHPLTLVSKKDRKSAEAAREAEKGRLLADKIRKGESYGR